MKNDLISRAEAIKVFEDYGMCDIPPTEAIDEIRCLPAVEAEIVPHGTWENATDFPGYARCSRCKNVYIDRDWIQDGKWNFCPGCGADLRAEAAEELKEENET